MLHRFDVEKAIEAAAVALRREGKTASRLRLLKLLYIADREALRLSGTPVFGSKVVAMKHGPLHSALLDLINGQHLAEPQWSRLFRNEGRNLVLADEPGVGRPSRWEIDLLNRVVDERLNLSDWDIVDETHSFAEWQAAYPDAHENTSRPIPLESLIDAVGRGCDKDAIVQDLVDSDAFEQFFSQVGK